MIMLVFLVLLLLLLPLQFISIPVSVSGCFTSPSKEEYEERSETSAEARRSALLSEGMKILRSSPQTRHDEEAFTAFTHLVRWMPDRDVTAFEENLPPNSASYLVRTTLETLTIRRKDEFGFQSMIPWNVFLDFVLPYAALSEPRDSLDFRTTPLGPFMREIAKNFTSSRPSPIKLSSLIMEMNRRAWMITSPPIKFEAASSNRVNFYSPREVVNAKRASCTGESVFFVAALRSIGIPSRVAGVPHWNEGPDKCPDGILSPACGNHNWVRVFFSLSLQPNT